MQEHDLFRIFISRLNRLGMRYIITGAVASTIYGEPRLTHDLDLVLELSTNEVEKFTDAFPPDEFYCPPPEVIVLEIGRRFRGHFNLIHQDTGFKADIYLSGQDKLHHWALRNRKSVDVEDEKYWLAPVEYVILRKLEYFREDSSEKHLRDIKGILELSSEQVDFEQLAKRIKDKALEKEWRQVKKFQK